MLAKAKLVYCLICLIFLFFTTRGYAADETMKWSGSGSLGLTQVNSDQDSLSGNGKIELSRKGVRCDGSLKLGANYGYVRYTTKNILSQNDFLGLYKADIYFSSARKPYLFLQPQFQSDEFQGFWGKYIGDAGLGYNWFSSDTPSLKTELGYSIIRWNYTEANDEGDLWESTHNGIARVIFKHKLNSWLTFGQEAQYSVNFDETDDYKIDSVTSASFAIASRLSYQVSFTIQYNNQPLMIEEKDENGNPVIDGDGNNVLTRADHTVTTWVNALVYSF